MGLVIVNVSELMTVELCHSDRETVGFDEESRVGTPQLSRTRSIDWRSSRHSLTLIPQDDGFGRMSFLMGLVTVNVSELMTVELCHSDRATARSDEESRVCTLQLNWTQSINWRSSRQAKAFLRMTGLSDYHFIVSVTTPLRMTGLENVIPKPCHSDRANEVSDEESRVGTPHSS